MMHCALEVTSKSCFNMMQGISGPEMYVVVLLLIPIKIIIWLKQIYLPGIVKVTG